MTTAPKKKYAFQTIVVPAEVRAEFTIVREDLMTTDKMLSQALWNIAMRDMGAVAHEVQGLKEIAAQLKEISNISKGEAEGVISKAAKVKKALAKKEPKPKKEKPAAKVKKEKAPKTVKFEGKEEPEYFVGEDDSQEIPCLVVNGL
jgi:hypothetical protein